MVDWDALEEAGHDLTHCGSLMAGASTYYCENCGAFMLIKWESVQVFHLPPASGSSQSKCLRATWEGHEPPTLKAKLDALRAQDMERLKEI